MLREIAKEANVQATDDDLIKISDNWPKIATRGNFVRWAREGGDIKIAPNQMVEMLVEASIDDHKLSRYLNKIIIRALRNHSGAIALLEPKRQKDILMAAIRTPGGGRFARSIALLWAKKLNNKSTSKNKKANGDTIPRIAADRTNIKHQHHINFQHNAPERYGTYTTLEVTWDPDDVSDSTGSESIKQHIVSYIKALASNPEAYNFGVIGRVTIEDIDVQAGVATVRFNSSVGPKTWVNPEN
jgi:hypothetical protein